MSQNLVGIDLSLCSHHIHFMIGEGQTLIDFSVPNDFVDEDTSIQEIITIAGKAQSFI